MAKLTSRSMHRKDGLDCQNYYHQCHTKSENCHPDERCAAATDRRPALVQRSTSKVHTCEERFQENRNYDI